MPSGSYDGDMTGTTSQRKPSRWWAGLRFSTLLGLACVALGAASIVGPLLAGVAATPLIAIATLICAAIEAAQAMRSRQERESWTVYLDAILLLLIGGLLFVRPIVTPGGLIFLIGSAFALAGAMRLWRAWKRHDPKGTFSLTTAGLVSIVLAIVMWLQWPVSGLTVVAVVVGLHILTTGISLLWAPDVTPAEDELLRHPDPRLNLPPHPHIGELRTQNIAAEESRWRIDVFWQVTLLITFFAIHMGRMRVEWNLVGLSSPLVATIGDIAAAVLVALTLIMPSQLLWRRLTRRLERRGWNWLLPRKDAGTARGIRAGIIATLLHRRLVFSERIGRSAGSVGGILHRALNLGLPVAAVLIAVAPMWGFNWYFNSENWVTAVWEHWAAHRTEDWREEMVRAVEQDCAEQGIPREQWFAVHPPEIDGAEDFSFLVIGDPGEGDESQYALKDQILALGSRPEVKFMVISSDVIYPAGAMIDYEPKFYMPFKGFGKPIYAVPGNHDWFDCLEGFNANFLDARSAQTAMRARIEVDHGITSTTDRRVNWLTEQAATLRRLYGIRNGLQRGPFFELHTDRFSLIAVDTGILRQIDEAQRQWLTAALKRAEGRFTMVILGHPFFAAGHDQGAGDEVFAELHQLLQRHGAEVVMAGDTHDLEYYRHAAGGRTMHHFVNGGGGAYLSIGTAMNWPDRPAVPDTAIYPRKDAIVAKLDAQTPWWKRPVWFWVRRFGAWPASPEGLAGAFNYNSAPFFQSFVEVRVERSANRVRFIPHSASGRLRWSDMQTTGAMPMADDFVEFIVPLRSSP